MVVVKREFVAPAFHDVVEKRRPMLAEVRANYAFDGDMFDLGVDCQEYTDVDGEIVETPSLTRQSDAEDCDINVMMARYQATGVEPRTNPREPQWGDFSSVPQYQEALEIIRQTQDDFMSMPAEARDRFANDPASMLAFLADPKNKDEAVRLGLVMPAPVEPPPAKVEVVNPPKPSKAKEAAPSAAVDGD